MSEFDDDAALHGRFAALRSESAFEVRPAGPDAVRATVRRHRRVRTATLSALAVALVAAPVAAYAAMPGDPHSPPNSPAASSTLEPTPSPTATTQSPTPAPDARAVDLKNATVAIPTWPGGATFTASCPAGSRTFVNGGADAVPGTPGAATYQLPAAGTQPVYADLDGQPGDEILVSLGCYHDGSFAPRLLLALKVEGDGTLHTLGSVVTAADDALLAYDNSVQVRAADRTVLVQVRGPWRSNGDYPAAQQRGYRYQEGQFRQVEGPTAMPTSLPTSLPTVARVFADLVVTSTDVVMSKPDPNNNGYTTGSQTITVTNKGAVPVAGAVVEFASPTIDRMDQSCDTSAVTNPQNGVAVWTCHLATLKAGQSQTLVIQYAWWGAVTPVSYPWYVKVTPDAPATDPVPANNRVSYAWRQAG